MSKADDTRTHLLETANRLIIEKGVANLTLAKVASAAGVSKGGLLYHFPNKDALIEALIEKLMEHAHDFIQAQRATDADTTGDWLRAYVRSCFDPEGAQLEESAGLLAALATNRALLNPMKRRYREWQQSAESNGIDPAMATIIRLAADGLWFAELLGFSPLSDDRREEVMQRLIDLTRPDG